MSKRHREKVVGRYVILAGRAIGRRPTTPSWQVNVLGALPLRNMSRVWGYLNSLELPIWFRPTGFKLYSWIFGCNLDEIEPVDLTAYPSLGEFFYRRLKPGVRPIAEAALVCFSRPGTRCSLAHGICKPDITCGWDRFALRKNRQCPSRTSQGPNVLTRCPSWCSERNGGRAQGRVRTATGCKCRRRSVRGC